MHMNSRLIKSNLLIHNISAFLSLENPFAVKGAQLPIDKLDFAYSRSSGAGMDIE
jgi:hypothetical protein